MSDTKDKTMNEDKIEEMIERKVEETVERKIEQKTPDTESQASALDDLIDQKVQEKFREQDENLLEEVSEKEVSRRGFLKTLGLGAGGLALASSVAGGSLLSGTTIGGNTAWHAGNDGSGSGLDADTVDGTEASDLGGDQAGWGKWKTVASTSATDKNTPTTTDTVKTATGSPPYSGSAPLRVTWRADGGPNTSTNCTFKFKKNGSTLFSTYKGSGTDPSATYKKKYQNGISFTSNDTWYGYGHVANTGALTGNQKYLSVSITVQGMYF